MKCFGMAPGKTNTFVAQQIAHHYVYIVSYPLCGSSAECQPNLCPATGYASGWSPSGWNAARWPNAESQYGGD
ncbi:hypothetical protein GCM10027185_19890 [Spirosoma pulveris]